MPKEDKPTLTATTIIDVEAVAALDAALDRAGAFMTQYALPLESSRRQGIKRQEAKPRTRTSMLESGQL